MVLEDAALPAQATAIGTVLLIDNQDLTRRSMARLLDSASSLGGLDIVEAASVAEAAVHADKPVRVVVLTPEGDGDGSTLPDTLRQLKTQGGSLGGAPVAVVLRNGRRGLPGDILELGVRGCIGPSVGAEDLVTALRLIIGGAVFIAAGVLAGDEPDPQPAVPPAPTLEAVPTEVPTAASSLPPNAPSLPPASLSRVVDVTALAASLPLRIPAMVGERPAGPPRARPAPVAATAFLRPAPASTETALTARETQVLLRLREGKPNKIIAHEMGISENTVKVHVRRILRKLRAANRTEAASFEDVEMSAAAPNQRRHILAPGGVPILRPLLPSS